MRADLAAGARAGLVMGAVFGAPLALAAPGSRSLLLVWLLIFPAGWVVARWCKVRDPAITAICAPVGALAALQLAEVPVALRYGGAILLAVASYAVAAYVTGAPLWQRVTAAGLLAVAVVVPAMPRQAEPEPVRPVLLVPEGPPVVPLSEPMVRFYVGFGGNITEFDDCPRIDASTMEELVRIAEVRDEPASAITGELTRELMKRVQEIEAAGSP
ncbi:hypothetical protein ACIBH1_08540 [Nonomuraea sp. NPDC050663]|uniref:hypothetical protein n=1 Tax=Nonomuraea sp. NPDC050663 TaxID=3364370 RepID=UPI003794B0F6